MNTLLIFLHPPFLLAGRSRAVNGVQQRRPHHVCGVRPDVPGPQEAQCQERGQLTAQVNKHSCRKQCFTRAALGMAGVAGRHSCVPWWRPACSKMACLSP